jgi:hypothetical protein
MKRPAIITFICVLGFISIVFSFPQVFSPQVKKLGTLMPAVFGLLVAADFMAYIGLWYLKRWGADLFTATYFIKTLLDIVLDQTGPTFYMGQVFSVFFIIVLLSYYRRLDKNL